MWESRLSGSERGWGATLVGKKYCGTAGKPGGKQRTQTSSYSQGSPQPTRTLECWWYLVEVAKICLLLFWPNSTMVLCSKDTCGMMACE